MPTDVELVRLAQNGDIEAVGELYDRHQSRIFRYVRSRIFDNRMAQDLTGDVFLRMVSNLHSYQSGEAPFTAWLYRIARNHVINHGRQQARRRPAPYPAFAEDGHSKSNPAMIVEEAFQLRQLSDALKQLEETQREVLVLRFLSGYSLKEVAAALDRSIPSVKAIQFRGLKSMRGLLKQVIQHERE